MGRFAKNLKIHSGSYAVGVPDGTNSFGPQFPVDGQIRFNVEIKRLQVWYNSRWNILTHGGRVGIKVDSFTGDGVQGVGTTTFTMSQPYDPNTSEIIGGYLMEAMVLVFIGNIFQNPITAYTISGNQITFTSVPDKDMPIVVLHNFNGTNVTQ